MSERQTIQRFDARAKHAKIELGNSEHNPQKSSAPALRQIKKTDPNAQAFRTESLERILGSQAENYFRQMERTLQVSKISQAERRKSTSQSRDRGGESNTQNTSMNVNLNLPGIAEVCPKTRRTLANRPRQSSSDKKQIPSEPRIISKLGKLTSQERIVPMAGNANRQERINAHVLHRRIDLRDTEDDLSIERVRNLSRLNQSAANIKNTFRDALKANQGNTSSEGPKSFSVGRKSPVRNSEVRKSAVKAKQQANLGTSLQSRNKFSQQRQESKEQDWIIYMPDQPPQQVVVNENQAQEMSPQQKSANDINETPQIGKNKITTMRDSTASLKKEKTGTITDQNLLISQTGKMTKKNNSVQSQESLNRQNEAFLSSRSQRPLIVGQSSAEHLFRQTDLQSNARERLQTEAPTLGSKENLNDAKGELIMSNPEESSTVGLSLTKESSRKKAAYIDDKLSDLVAETRQKIVDFNKDESVKPEDYTSEIQLAEKLNKSPNQTQNYMDKNLTSSKSKRLEGEYPLTSGEGVVQISPIKLQQSSTQDGHTKPKRDQKKNKQFLSQVKKQKVFKEQSSQPSSLEQAQLALKQKRKSQEKVSNVKKKQGKALNTYEQHLTYVSQANLSAEEHKPFQHLTLPAPQQQIVYVPVPVTTAIPQLSLPFHQIQTEPFLHSFTPQQYNSQYFQPQNIQTAMPPPMPPPSIYQAQQQAQPLLMAQNNTNHFYNATGLQQLQGQIHNMSQEGQHIHTNQCSNCGHNK